jgi:large subunit ribosomal protein L25
MADQVDLATRPRAGSGKSEARALRREGRVPAIAYGVGLEPTALSVDARELYHALHTHAGENAIIRLTLDGGTHLALAREVQRHPVRRDVLHVDFVTVSRNVKVSVEVPITLEGEAEGAQQGGVVEQAMFALNVQVLPLEVPDSLPLDVSALGIGDVLRVGDVPLPAGVDLLDDPELPVVSVVVPALDVPEEESAAERAADEFEAGGKTADEAEVAAAASES